MPAQTPSQTVGPFYAIGLIQGGENILVNEKTSGQPILIRGFVYDGKGEGVRDAVIETWQTDSNGIFNHPTDKRHKKADPHFFGFGRAPAHDNGSYWLRTIKPGAMPSAGSEIYAPHIGVRVFMRGMLIQAHTRMYFSDEETANMADPIFSAVDPSRRQTLVATLVKDEGLPTYEFDIHMQGTQETVFFNP